MRNSSKIYAVPPVVPVLRERERESVGKTPRSRVFSLALKQAGLLPQAHKSIKPPTRTEL